jgi:hypothetical protein
LGASIANEIFANGIFGNFQGFPEDIIINENKLGIFGEVNLELQNLHSSNLGIVFLWRSFA